MNQRFLFLFLILSLIVLPFQNCTLQNSTQSHSAQTGNQTLFSEVNTPGNMSGNGGTYDGKLSLLHLKSGFTCEGNPAPKSVLTRKDNGQWTLITNTSEKCASTTQIIGDLPYSYPSHFQTFDGATYSLNLLNAKIVRQINVDPTADPNSPNTALPTLGTCTNKDGKCSLRAAFDVLNNQDLPTIIHLPAGTYNLNATLKNMNFSPLLMTGVPGKTILNGQNINADSILSIAAIYRENSDPTFWSPTVHIQGITFMNGNTNSTAGSAINLIQGSLLISQGDIFQNGGIYAVKAESGSNQIIIEDTLIHDNPSSVSLAALNSSQLHITRSDFFNNKISLSSEFVYNVNVNQSAFYNSQYGFILVGCGQTCLIENSTFYNNIKLNIEAKSFVLGNDGDVTLRNVTAAHSEVNLSYIKFHLGQSYVGKGRLLLQNSILSNSKFMSAQKTNCAFETIGYTASNAAFNYFSAIKSLVDDQSCGTKGFILADPQLEPLAMNGGSTPTLLPSSTSPALDAGDNRYCPLKDQRDFLRPIRFLKTSSQPVCDIGAVEVQ